MRFPLIRLLIFGGLLLTEPAPAAEPDVIRFATVNANYRVALEEIIRRYQVRNPHLKVELSVIGQEFATWIRTRVAAGGDLVPDIYNGNYTNGYDRQGRWVALDPYLEAENPYTGKRWIDGIDGRLIERYRVDGKAYLLPIDYIDIAVFYNRDLFDELGLREPETWGGMASALRAHRAGGLRAHRDRRGRAGLLGGGDGLAGATIGRRVFAQLRADDDVPTVCVRSRAEVTA